MPFTKGNTSGKGRKKGSQNKVSGAVKDALTLAFDGIGGVDALMTWGKENQAEFYQLWVRMLPKEQIVDLDVREVAKLSDEELEQRRRKLKLVA